jgi:RNA polymerase sigma-70 factor (ECF subfamily)
MQQATELWTNWTRHRDERSFEALVRPELPHALGFAQRLGCNTADAEDAVQDALARLVAVRDDSPTALGLRAWLCREVHVRARSRLRSERRRRTREAATAVAASVPAGSSLAVREEVERALAGLDEDERAAVQLRYLHDLDYREMAVVLATSEGACRKRVHKALARLRARFGDEAAAVVAALPLPAVHDVSVLVKGAFTKAAVASAATGGAVVMATTTQKVAIAVVVAALLGVGGTLAVQHVMAPDSSTVDSAAAADPRADEIAKRDAEIARLRTQLSDSKRRRAAAKSGDETLSDVKPVPTAPTSTNVAQAAGANDAKGGASPTSTVDPVAAPKQAQAWQEALRQVSDPAKRDAAWAEVRNALAGADRTALLAALQTVAFTMDVKLDRQGLRDLLLPSVDAAESPVRLMAWQALINNGIESVDVDKLRGQILDGPKEIRPDMVQRLVWSMGPTKGAIDGPSADVVLKVMEDPAQIKDTVRALNNAKLNDAVVAKVLEYARTSPEAAQHATHFVLRTMPDKNHDVVAFLLDRAQAGDLSAIEGLQWGIRPEDVAYAGERLRKLYDARSALYVREQLIQRIGGIGDQSSRDWLTALRDDSTQPAQIQSAARSALQVLDRPRR